MKMLTAALAVCLLVFLSGCEGLGERIRAGYTVHNTATVIVTELNEAELIPLEDAKEFREVQLMALEGLDGAAAAYFNESDDVVEELLDAVEPLLERMVEIQEDSQ